MKTINKPIGVIAAGGVGPEIMDAALECLAVLGNKANLSFRLSVYSGLAPATEYTEKSYRQLHDFYEKIRSEGGCVIRGAIYARLVYRLRAEFSLVTKPIYYEPIPELYGNSLLREGVAEKFSLLLVRENAQGLFFSKEKVTGKKGRRVVEGTFTYEEGKVRALVEFAFEQASKRRNVLNLFIKGDTWQKLAPLWLDIIELVHKKYPAVKFDWDHADTGFANLLIHPERHDVVIALGSAADLISDPLATLIYGSHTIIPSANISPEGFMVFQTVHGTAHAIAGQNKANPIGMIRAVAMMLKLFFTLENEANLIEDAIRKVLKQGYRTIDLHHPNTKHELVGTKEMGNLIARAI